MGQNTHLLELHINGHVNHLDLLCAGLRNNRSIQELSFSDVELQDSADSEEVVFFIFIGARLAALSDWSSCVA